MAASMRVVAPGASLQSPSSSHQRGRSSLAPSPLVPSTSSSSNLAAAAAAGRRSSNPSSRWQAPLPSTAARRLPPWTTRKHPSSPLLTPPAPFDDESAVSTPLNKPPAADSSEPLFPSAGNKRGPPTLIQRIAAALPYLIPFIDVTSIGSEALRTIPQLTWVHNLPGPFVKYYYSSQFAPLVVFFLIYLAVVRNNKIHHFVRFHAMQATMLDIVSMIFTILRGYLPPGIMWSPAVQAYDTFAYTICLMPVLYCIVYALDGKYADVPFVSESVYLQVDASA